MRILNLLTGYKQDKLGLQAPSDAHATNIDITNVARWFYEVDDREFFDWRADFPSVTPPYSSVWMEASLPPNLTSRSSGRKMGPGCEWGLAASVISMEVSPDMAKECMQTNGLIGFLNGIHGTNQRAEVSRELLTELDNGVLVRWLVAFVFFFQRKKQVLWAGSFGLYLDEYGQVLESGARAAIQRPGGVDARSIESYAYPFMFALSLMHCKNVELKDASPTPSKVAAQRAKKGVPDIKFKTLVIDPMRKQIKREKSEDGQEASEVQRALHICRGHFKDYREKPLFGKFADVYWWEPHVRGNAKNGAIVKDYKVNAPEATP